MKKQVIVLSILVFLSLNLLVFFGSYRNINELNAVQRETFYTREKVSIDSSKNIMLNQISIILADLKFVGNNIVDMERLDVDRLYVNELWKDFLESKGFYDQIRFIDKDGLEKIRVNAGKEFADIVPEALLQNKASRYYFKDTIDLDPEDYYISRLDLNVENENIEVPYKPMIRFSKPIYDGEKLIGVSVINYLANYLLDNFMDNIENSNSTDVFLLNEDGYWLFSSNNKFIEWGFMFSEYENSSFKNLEPVVWEKIKTNTEGFVETDQGIYTYTAVLPESERQEGLTNIKSDNIVLGEGNWYIVTFLSNDDDGYVEIYNGWSYLRYIFVDHLKLTLGIIMSILLLSVIFGWYLRTKIQAEKSSKYDEMTLAYHRQYGLGKAEELYKHCMKNKLSLGIIFCDINGLKHVNDTYGHEVGDTLIKAIAQTIQQEIRWEQHYFLEELYVKYLSRFKKKSKQREHNMFIRLGGDEFLLLFKDIRELNLNDLWERIVSELSKKYVKDVQVSASKGIIVITPEMEMTLEEGIKLADEAMYKEKSAHYLARS